MVFMASNGWSYSGENDILDNDLMEVIETKTGKFRRIKMNPHFIEIIERIGICSNFVNIYIFEIGLSLYCILHLLLLIILLTELLNNVT